MNREFAAEMDSSIYRQIMDFAASLGVEMRESCKRELAAFAYECEIEIERQAREAALRPPPLIIRAQ